MTELMPPSLEAARIQERYADRPMEAFLICDDDLRVVHASKGLERLLRLSPDAVAFEDNLHRVLTESAALDGPMRAAIADRLDAAFGGPPDGALHAPGGADEEPLMTAEVKRVGGTHWIISFEDLAARREANERLVTLTLTDALTGLGNRSRFRQSLIQALVESPTASPNIALISIDLDRFKTVNDTLGHAVGDKLLRKVGGRLRSVIRQTDMLARLGGDEFAAWMPVGVDRGATRRIAGRIIDLLSRPFLVDGMQIHIGASLGIAMAPRDGETYDALMKAADLALYSAKAAGRSTFHFFDMTMEERVQERRRLEVDLRGAQALQQFDLHYRPQIDVETGVLVALEAHLRWRHPERGLLEPASFMPIAEETGLVGQIGHWMIDAACRQAISWPERVKLVVSLSASQFESGTLVQMVRGTLAAWGLPPSRLQLEITESVLLRNETAVVSTLHALRATGVGIGISNFGTGYASLTKLDSFPFDRIRMDSSLLEGQVAPNSAIISAVAAFGASRGVSTTVDGIRSAAQLEEIKAGAGMAIQGLLCVAPLPQADLDRMLTDRMLDESPSGPALPPVRRESPA
jgi:diguanylate cyclase (GGDEF)-like protein